MRSLAFVLAAFCATSLLAGCASARLASVGLAEPVLRPPRADIRRFLLEGRISVRQGESRHMAHLSWNHAPDHDNMLLTTPFGQGLAELSRDARGAHLRLSDQRQFDADDQEALAHRLFGLRLPLTALPQWVTGQISALKPGIAEDDATGRPQRRQAAGWQISYADYETPAVHALPTLIEMRHEIDDMEVRLKVDRWQVLP
jgi:outer membrane lipoprotein LolB